jgi:hypothetical protein
VKPILKELDLEREGLPKWNWGDLPEPNYRNLAHEVVRVLTEMSDDHQNRAAEHAANVVLDQIQEDAEIYYDHFGVVTVYVLGDLHLHVPLRELLLEAANSMLPEPGEDDKENPVRQLADHLREITAELDALLASAE